MVEGSPRGQKAFARELAERGASDAYRPDLAMTLNNLAANCSVQNWATRRAR